MKSNKFEETTKRILSSENLQTVRDNHNAIDHNLLDECQKFVSFNQQSVKLNEKKLEPTDLIDIRVKKCNELDERLKKFTKNMKKKFKQTGRHCDRHEHERVEPIEIPVLLSQLEKNVIPRQDVESILKRDAAALQQHECNIEKVNKLMETIKGYKFVEAKLPAAEPVNESVAFLQEIVKDVDYLNESGTMYSGLSEQAPNYLYTEEIKELSNHLYMP